MASWLDSSSFHPTQEAASDILIALADPEETLLEIAQRFHTTLDALADWIDTPPVQQRIEKMKRLAATREDLVLTVNKRMALDVLLSILQAHLHDEQHIPVDPQNLKSVTQRDRRRAAARLAASQLLRLANKNPLPEGGGRGWVSDHTDTHSGPGGTGVLGGPPVHSEQGLQDSGSRPQRTPTAHNSQISQSQAGRLRHPDHQSTSPPSPCPSPSHIITSSPPHASPLPAPPCDPVLQLAAGEFEAG